MPPRRRGAISLYEGLANAALLVGLLPAILAAQQVRGTLRDSASAAPLNGGVISIVDSAGTVTTRTVANGAGQFTLLRGPRDVSLHVIRIGYRPRDLRLPPPRANGGENLPLSIDMVRVPPILSTVRVSETELCPGSQDRGAAFQLWQQARAGLLAAVVARETNPPDVTTLVYERHLDARGGLIARQVTISRLGRTSRPFISAVQPETFARIGYIQEDSTGDRIYNAPDEVVLLDESFASTHCFHLQSADSAHAGQIGLAFTPTTRRDTLVDVAGVIWMNAASPALRTLEFRYTNIEPAAEDAGAGGEVHFRSADNGASFIDWWNLRLPVMVRPVLRAPDGPPPPDTRPRRQRADYRVDEMAESGGEVVLARWADGTIWRAPVAGITGVITRRGTGLPVPFAVVKLDGTSETATTAADGRFTLAPLVPGRYSMIVNDTVLTSFTPARTATRVVTVARDSVVAVAQDLPEIGDVVALVCKGQWMAQNPSVILGHVRLAGARGREVRATWHGLSQSGAVETADISSTVDDQGRFIICGPSRGIQVQLRVVHQGSTSDTTFVTADSSMTMVNWSGGRASTGHPPSAGSAPAALRAGAPLATLTWSTHLRRLQPMSDHSEPHNGRDLHGNYGVPSADVEDLLENPDGAERVRDNVKTAGAIADTGPHAAEPAQHITELITENRDDVGRVTGRSKK